jgi:hypothetical protein
MQSVTISFVLGLLIGLVVAYIAIVHIYGMYFSFIWQLTTVFSRNFKLADTHSVTGL